LSLIELAVQCVLPFRKAVKANCLYHLWFDMWKKKIEVYFVVWESGFRWWLLSNNLPFVSFFITGVDLNHLGRVGEENKRFYQSNGKVYLCLMGNCVMVVLCFWRKHEVGYVAVSTVTDFFTVLFSYSSGLMLIFFMFLMLYFQLLMECYLFLNSNAGYWSKS
jgi:hypothetical protein